MSTKSPYVTLVTGATKGIGRAVSDMLAADGQHVVGMARGSDASFPGDLIQCDLADSAALAATLAEVAKKYSVDHVVNGVGLVERASLADISTPHLDRMLYSNVYTAVACTQAMLPHMLAKKRGRVINIASRAMLGRPGSSVYAAAKAALVGLSRSWALELATSGVTVNVVAPGTTDTENFRRVNPPNTGEQPAGQPKTPDWSRIVPMGRIGDPKEVAAAIRYFLSDEAAYTTGQVMYVCGGLSIGTAQI